MIQSGHIMTRASALLVSWLTCAALVAAAADTISYRPSALRPPAPLREFRGAWVATVKNIDWPSQPGLSTAQQQAEMIAILDRAVQLKLNAIVLQVRPSCDAIYASKLEPWSEYLTGRMGHAPDPYYDPLSFAVTEAHRRGLELHAWFNPFRALHPAGSSPIAAGHISKTQPGLVRRYGSSLWLDPGEPAVHDQSLKVILDVVRRYDIDGVHLDDYFYPYQERDRRGRVLDFPDDASWNRYRHSGGKMVRGDWRRENVDKFVHRLYTTIKAEKKWVQFGISPFGIWRPGHPAQIRGFDAYDGLYADSRKWLAEGWLDYFTPQLYWSIEPKEQSYPALLRWWAAQNTHKRHLWPGNSISRIGPHRPASEIVNQIRLTRNQAGASGNLLWSMRALMENRGGIDSALHRDVYNEPALIPATPWLDSTAPAPPRTSVSKADEGAIKVHWNSAANEPVRLWVLQTRTGGTWKTELIPAARTFAVLASNHRPEVIAVSAVDRCGNSSRSATLEKTVVAAK